MRTAQICQIRLLWTLIFAMKIEPLRKSYSATWLAISYQNCKYSLSCSSRFASTCKLHGTRRRVVLVFNYSSFIVCRALIFPMLLRGAKPATLCTFVLAILFCTYNGYMQSVYLLKCGAYPADWTHSPTYMIGKITFDDRVSQRWS